MKKAKLSDEERAVRAKASQKAWRERNRDYWATWQTKNPERIREYHRTRVTTQRRTLLEAGCVPNPVGRPRKDGGDLAPAPPRVRGEAYKAYQRAYQKQYKAKRLAAGWVQVACGMVPPEFAAVLRDNRPRPIDENPP